MQKKKTKLGGGGLSSANLRGGKAGAAASGGGKAGGYQFDCSDSNVKEKAKKLLQHLPDFREQIQVSLLGCTEMILICIFSNTLMRMIQTVVLMMPIIPSMTGKDPSVIIICVSLGSIVCIAGGLVVCWLLTSFPSSK